MTHWKSVLASALAGLGLLANPVCALAAPGSLDPTFDGDGRATIDRGSPDEGADDVAVQPDGKVLVLGASTDSDTFVTTRFLVRYDSTGALDPTFDDDGVLALTGIPSGGVAVQPDGKIILAGSLNQEFAVARLEADGSFDTTFDEDGIATADSFGNNEGGGSVALQPDGKIVVAGSSDANHEGRTLAVARFNGDGTVDTSFSEDGRVIWCCAPSSGGAVAIQADGRIAVAGSIWSSRAQTWRFLVGRLNADGTPDSSFSGDGKAATKFGTIGRAFGVAVQADGKIVAAGYAGSPSGADFALARYTLGGRLDSAFSDDGKQRTDFSSGNDEGRGLVIQANGRIIVGGFAAPPRRPDDANFALARYRPGGRLDSTFSIDGKQRARFGTNHQDYGFAVALQGDGKILVAGAATLAQNEYDFGVARFLGS